MAEDLILRMQEVDIAGCHHRLSKFLTKANHRPVELAQFLLFLDGPLCQHKAVVGKRLDLQIIIKRCDALEFIVALAVNDRLEQLSCLTGRADDETLPVLNQLRLGNSGNALKILQIGVRDQMVEVSQTHLILSKQDNVSCVAVADPILGTQLHHRFIDRLQGMNALFLQHLQESAHNHTADHRVVCRAMVIEVGQAQCIGHQIQLEFTKLGHQILGKDQGIRRGKGIRQSLPGTFCPDKPGIKVGVVGDQDPVPHEFQKFRQYFFDGRGAPEHGIRNTGKLHNPAFQRTLRVNKGLEAIQLFPVFHKDSADFNNTVILGRQAGGLQIKGNILPVKGHILITVDNDAVIHIIDIIALTAVEDLDHLVCARHLRSAAPGFNRVQRIREGLDHAVVGDGDGTVTPGCRLLDGGFRIRQGIHIAHNSMQMQLYALPALCGILPLGHSARHNCRRLQYRFIIELIDGQFALHLQHRACLYIFKNRLCLAAFQKAVDTDRAGIISHIEADDPGIALFQFLMLNSKDSAFYHHTAHIQIQFRHGNCRSLKRATEERLTGLCALFFFGNDCHLR